MWNTRTREARTVPDSRGAATVVLVPPANRAYAVTTEGSLLTLDLGTLAPIGPPVDLGAGDIAHALFDPAQNRVHLVTGARAEKSGWLALDAATGQVVARAEFSSRTMSAPAVGPEGGIFSPLRDRSLLNLVDGADLSVRKTWRLGECQQPSATLWEPVSRRVLIACRGDKPVFVALDPAAGIVATIPIGRGADGIAFDAERKLVVIANGGDGTLSVIRQDGPGEYVLVETTTTRPGARVLAMDEATRRLFSVAATFTQQASAPGGGTQGAATPGTGPDRMPAPVYHPDSFTILTYRAP